MKPVVSIVIPAFNQLDYCKQCLHSLLAHTTVPHKLILVDNGSDDGVGPFFDSIPGAVVVHTGSNRGFAGGVNAGLAHCEGHALLLNSDTIVPRHWLEPMLAVFERDDTAGLVGPRSNCVSGPQEMACPNLESMDAINALANALRREKHAMTTPVERLVGFCLLIRDRCLADLGGLDEQYGIGNFEDDDYCMRARRAGYSLLMAEDAFVFHYGSRTFQAMGLVDDAWRDLMARNAQLHAEKWGSAVALSAEALDEARRLNRQAAAELRAGDGLAALRTLREAIAVAPEWEVNYNDLGVVLWQMGKGEEALRYFEAALLRNAHYRAARENIAAIRNVGSSEGSAST